MGAGKGKRQRLQAHVSNKSELLEYMASLGLDLYLVGGSVRDELLGRASQDLDFIVLGLDENEALAALLQHGRASVTGESFGVIRFRPRAHRSAEFEVALPRKETSTGPEHRDFDVEHGGHVTLEEDLRRRDFTVNAMAHNLHTNEVVDPYGGGDDLKNKRLRLVNPNAFAEDPLRILRGLQMVSRFDLQPTEETTQLMREHAPLLKHIPGERKMMEMEKLLSGEHRREALELMRDTGTLEYVLPRLAVAVDVQQNKYHAYDVYKHCVEACAAVRSDSVDLRWAALLHDIGKPAAKFLGEDGEHHFYNDPADPAALTHEQHGVDLATAELEELRLPSNRVKKIGLLVAEHGFVVEKPTPRRARRLLARVGEENIEELLLLKEADQLGSGKGDTPERQQRFRDLKKLRGFVADTIRDKHAFKIKDLKIGGTELMGAGIPSGPRIGRALKHLLEASLEDPSINEPDSLLERALAFDRAQKQDK